MRFFVMLLIPQVILCRNALDFFIKRKKIKGFSLEELEVNENLTRWIEYKYIFDIKNESPNFDVANSTLKVGVYRSNFLKFDNSECRFQLTKNNETHITGYDVAIIRHIQEAINIRIKYYVINDLKTLESKEIDLAICVPLLDQLSDNVTKLYPTIRNNLLLVFKPNQLHIAKDIFIQTFAGSLWVVFFAIMILLAICLRTSTTRYATIKPKYEAWTWVEITLWAIAAACQQGLSHTPSGFASCLIFFLGYLMAYLLYTGFAAAITSILVENVGTNSDLKSVRTERVHLVAPQYTKFYIKQLQERFLVTDYVGNLDELFERIDQINTIGVGPGIPIEQYVAVNFNLDHLTELQVMKLNVKYTKSFLTTINSPWRKIINKHLVALYEYGILQNKFRRNLKPTSSLSVNSGYSSAEKEHVGSAIILFLAGVLLALIFFVMEFIFHLYKQGSKTRKK